jgi:hypothetical protein
MVTKARSEELKFRVIIRSLNQQMKSLMVAWHHGKQHLLGVVSDLLDIC